MASLPVEALLGISFGLLVGIVPAFLVGVLAYLRASYEGVGLSRGLAVALGLALTVANAALSGVVEPVPQHAPRILLATFVAVILSLYANSQAEWLATSLPRDAEQPTVRGRTLSGEAVDAIDGTGHVSIAATGGVRDVDGYPRLPPALRTELEEGRWRLPADLPLSELETRLADRLRTEYDLARVSVSIDARGRATVAAAPPSGGVAPRTPAGHRAVSVGALVPTGLSAGDEVLLDTPDGSVSGVVLSVGAGAADDGADVAGTSVDADATAAGTEAGLAPDGDATDGGAGRVTVAVPTEAAGSVLSAPAPRVLATSSGTRHDFEAFSVLERAGVAIREVLLEEDLVERVGDGSADLHVLAVEPPATSGDDRGEEWEFAPEEDALPVGGTGFVAGPDAILGNLPTGGRVAGETEGVR